ncbi:MAG: metal ABC transporter permease [Clostridia bacterium]|nr:metal ABC transporter permease [Clostridia bacterium]
MTEIAERLYYGFFYLPTGIYALIVSVLVALCSSLLGVTLVLKRFSFIGDGLSHVAFGAMAVAAVVGLTNQMFIAMPVTIICAVLLLKAGGRAKIRGDASVALISVGALAVGYLLMNLFPSSASGSISADVCSTLFGSYALVTLTGAEVWLCVVLSVVAITLFILFYNKIFAVTFDENFAVATGIKANLYNLITAILIAVVIVLAMRLVGSLLISALIIFPAISAMRVFKTFKSVTLCSAILSVICTAFGVLLSVVIDTPVGPTIVCVDIIVFFAFWLIGSLKGGKAK